MIGKHRHLNRRPYLLGAAVAAILLVATLPLASDGSRTGEDQAEGGPAPASPTGAAGVGQAPLRPPSDANPFSERHPDQGVPPVPSGFPGPDNTGVPSGTELASYQGDCHIRQADTVIEASLLECTVNIDAPNVVIRTSKIVGQLDVLSGSLTLEDSEVDNGTAYTAAVGGQHLTIRRSNIHGGETSVNCGDCHIEDSWLHGQYVPPDGDWHLDAYLSNGGGNVTLVHNTLACDHPGTDNGGGCTAAAAIFGDFGPLSDFTFDNNLFVASPHQAYCFYGGTQDNKPYGLETSDIVVVNNVFQRGENGQCGGYGPVTNFANDGPGHRWQNNTWDDGEPLSPQD